MMPNLQTLRTDERDRLRFEYFEPGVAYYLAGRSLYYASFASPSAAILFHMAVERFLKGCLIGVGLTEKERRALDHKLGDLWMEFRKHAPDPALDAHADTIRKLDEFYVFRYPENVARDFKKKGLGSCTIMMGPLIPGNNPDFHCDIDEIDSLVLALQKAGSVNPKAMATHLKPEGLDTLQKHNAHAAEWA